MKVTYQGPSGSGVDVIHPDPDSPDTTTVTHCPPSETVELPDDVAREHIDAGTLTAVVDVRKGKDKENA